MRNGRLYGTVAGTIGVGKSTQVGIPAEEFDRYPCDEPVSDPLYLEDDDDHEGWRFHTSIRSLT